MPPSAAIEDSSSQGSRKSLVHEPSVDDVLYSLRGVPFRRQDLRDFMESEYNAENVDFWARAEEYRQVYGNGQAPKLVRVSDDLPSSSSVASKSITSTYVATGAPHEINLSASMRDLALRKASEGDPEAFVSPQGEVRKLIFEDSFPRFLLRATKQNLTNSHARWRYWFGIKILIVGLLITAGIIGLEVAEILHTPFVRLVTWIIFVAGFGYYISGYQRV